MRNMVERVLLIPLVAQEMELRKKYFATAPSTVYQSKYFSGKNILKIVVVNINSMLPI